MPDNCGCSRCRPGRGFTLIELILVLTLLSVIASIIAPSLGNFMRGRSLDSEARRLLSVMHAARSRAISEGMPIRVTIDPVRREYGMHEDFVPKSEEDDNTVFRVDENVQINVKEAGTKPVTIRFMPDETIEDGSQVEISLSDSSGAVMRVAPSKSRNFYEILREKE